jgi:transposase
VEVDPTRICELLVGLREVSVLGIIDEPGGPLRVHVETRGERPTCPGCARSVAAKDQRPFELVDLPAFGRPTRLVWRKHRWSCPVLECGVGSFTETADRVAASRRVMTDRAGRWATEQVGRYGRTVNEIAVDLDCAWHTINDTVIAYGTALVDDPAWIGAVEALGLDEVLFARQGPWRTLAWSTSIVALGAGQLLDLIPGRSAAGACRWLAARGSLWLKRIRFAVLDLSGPWRLTLDTMLPDAVQIADPFHLVKLANTKLDECRRWVQNETLGHRGHKDDPLYRGRRLLTMADERLDDRGRAKLMGLLEAGDPRGEVRMAWYAEEVVRSIYHHRGHKLAIKFVTRLGHDLQDESCPPEVNQPGRIIIRWSEQIAAWHRAHESNGPTEANNNLIKRVKRVSVYRPLEARCWMVRDRRVSTGETRDVGRPGGWRCESSEFKGATGLWMAPPWTCRIWRRERSRR